MATAIRCFLCLALVPALVAGQAATAAAETLPGPYPAAVERVVDGDTLGVRVAIWLGQELSVLVRIRGIDAPELRGRCDGEKTRARDAASALQRLVTEGAVVLTRIEGDKYFGRVVADVATPEGGDIGAALVAGGHARAYDGGARRSWCEIGSWKTDEMRRRASFATDY
jgi:endonuclease YncB( thermonuclease family)